MAPQSSDADIYRRCYDMFSRLYTRTTKHSQLRPSAQAHKDSPDSTASLSLPLPGGIFSSLLDTGCPIQDARELSDHFMNLACRAQSHWLTKHTEACQRAHNSQMPPEKRIMHLTTYSNVVNARYQTHIRQLEEQAIKQATLRAHALEVDANLIARSTFNQEFVPMLEEYFKHNAYPNASHRIFLATRSNMSLRQIAVWFQNHRNRARKEGKQIQKNPSIRLNVVLSTKESPEDGDESRLSPGRNSDDGKSNDGDEDDSEEEDEEEDEEEERSFAAQLHVEEPCPAFLDNPPRDPPLAPFSSLKECCSSEPQERNLQTIWDRKPAEPRPSKKSVKKVDRGVIDNLCISLATLQARYLNKHGKPSKKKTKRKRRWDVHLRTIAETAPLPSFVLNPNSEPVHPIKISQTKPAPISQVKNAFKSYQDSPTTLIPPPPPTVTRHSGPTKHHRPRPSTDRAQTPTRSYASSRASTPSSSSSIGSPLFSPAPPSRRRRLEADSSSSSSDEPSPKRRRTSLSSSSSSSSSSSAIATPLLGPRQLSNAGKPSIADPQSEFDFTSLDDQISRPPPLTWAEAFHFGFQPPTMTAKDMSFTLDFTDPSWQTQPSVYVPP